MQLTSKFRDWASMARLPNVPTVWSNVFTGWALACGSFTAVIERIDFYIILLAATMIYIGGTLINDWHDVDFDRQHRPERPIPSGRVSRTAVGVVGFLLLGFGTLITFPLNNFYLLPPLILLYTWLHKSVPLFGCVLMGLCRMALGFGVYLGGSENFRFDDLCNPVDDYWALTLFAYVVIISWIATGEGVAWRRKTVIGMLTALPLLDAAFLMMGGEMRLILVPLGCFGLAWYLRRVASPT